VVCWDQVEAGKRGEGIRKRGERKGKREGPSFFQVLLKLR
jgi:hypothetical protein